MTRKLEIQGLLRDERKLERDYYDFNVGGRT